MKETRMILFLFTVSHMSLIPLIGFFTIVSFTLQFAFISFTRVARRYFS